MVVDGVPDEERDIRSDVHEFAMQPFLADASRFLETTAKLDTVYADAYLPFDVRVPRKFVDRDHWIWIADEGKVLKKIELPIMYHAERK